MKYMLIIYGNQETWDSFDPELMAEVIRETDALNAEPASSGELVGAYGLADQVQSRIVRVRDDVPAVTDGPYLEAKEYLASFTIVDCDGLERALEIAARNPASRFGQVEVWPILHEAGVEM
jgi:hypothetical protein